MKLVDLVIAGSTTDGNTVYISAGDGYFPRFGSYPLPTGGDVYKFANSDKLYIWDGTLLRPSQPEEGDIAYGSDGRYAATYKFGLWVLGTSTESSDNPTCCEQCDGDREVYELRIGNVVLDIDPVQFVADNRELIDAIMTEYFSSSADRLSDKQKAPPFNFSHDTILIGDSGTSSYILI